MPEYSADYSKRKMKAILAIQEEVDRINAIKASGGKVKGNEPKMTLRGMRTLLVSEDSLFEDLLEKYESGKLSAFQLAQKARTRTEKIGKNEVIVHSDTIHHGNPLELADALDEMDPEELADTLTERYETKGDTYGDTRENVRGQSYTTRGHLAQTTNPRGRYKATNEYSEPGVTEISAHPRGANDPLMKAPDVKPKTRKEALEFLESKQSIIEESKSLGAYADKDVRALADLKLQERGIILPNQTIYDPSVSDETLQVARASLDNLADEIELAKAFKTPVLRPGQLNVAQFLGKVPIKGATAGAIIGGATPGFADVSTFSKVAKGDIGGAAVDTAVGGVTGGATEVVTRAAGRVGLQNAARFLGKVAGPAFTGVGIAQETFLNPSVQKKYQEAEPGLEALGAAFSQFTPKTDKVEQTAPNRFERRQRSTAR